MKIRAVRVEDMPAIAAIYADAVLHDTASFELEPPDVAEMERRWRSLGDAYPYLVMDHDGAVVGYAYAGPFRTRPAYRATCEDSIYVSPAAKRMGVGRALLRAIIEDVGFKFGRWVDVVMLQRALGDGDTTLL